MGLLTGLVTLPLAPVRGVTWTMGQVVGAAEEEHIRALRAELVALEQLLIREEISDDEFDQREDTILDRLDELGAGLLPD
jgi:hypothetical protein